jgi:DNA-binding NarL/FixJ family response regulator
VPHLARCVSEALALLARIDVCYSLVDQQLPFELGDEPMLGGSEAVLRAIREEDSRRNGLFHVTPAIVVTSYSGHEDFVGKMYDLGASAFMSKPIRGNEERLLDKIRTALERGGRGAHAGCAGLIVVPTFAVTVVSESVQVTSESEEDVGAARVGGIAAQIGAKVFSELAVRLVDGHTVRISCKRRRVHATYIDLGFAGKTRQPLREWALFQGLCGDHGVLRAKACGSANNARQRLFVLSRNLKAATGLADEPFRRAREVGGWRANFFASSDIAGDEG